MLQGSFSHSQPWLEQVASTTPIAGMREVLWHQSPPFLPLSHTQTMWRCPIHTHLSLLTLHYEGQERGKQQTPAMQTNRSQIGIWKAVFTTKSPTSPPTMRSPRRQRAPRKRKTKVWTPSSASNFLISPLWASEAFGKNNKCLAWKFPGKRNVCTGTELGCSKRQLMLLRSTKRSALGPRLAP